MIDAWNSSRHGRDGPSWFAQAILIASAAWGALAFGGVYPWVYWPLAATAITGALLSLLAASGQPSVHLAPLATALMLFAAAVALQLMPLSHGWLMSASPTALDVVSSFDLAAAGNPGSHPLSIAPHLTATGLVLFVSFSLLLVGSARLFTIRGGSAVAHAVAIIGVLLAMIAIVQKPLSPEKIYGFWMPLEGYRPYGPFVNNNHFAGWMLMALPLTVGLLSGGVVRAMRHVKPTVRDRFIWMSSPDANRLMLLAGAAAVMALSLTLTLSRSGIASGLFALLLMGMVTIRRQMGMARRTLLTGYVVLLVIAVAAWAGIDTIASHFAEIDSSLSNRWGAWLDAAAIAARFPLTGTGLNTYSIATLYYQTHDRSHHYSTAHSDYLQLVAEGGVLLTVPAILCIGLFATAVRKRFREETSASGYWIRVGAVTGISAIALQEVVEFSLQMPGNAALFAVLCGIALHRSPERAAVRTLPRA